MAGHPMHAAQLRARNNSYAQAIEEAYEEIEGSHRCAFCDNRKDVQDYQKETPSWCDECEQVRTFREVDDD